MNKKLSALQAKFFNANTFFFLLAVVLLLAYQLIYWNKTYPITEGWGINYVNLIISGKIPYKDFYYYLPPLNLLIDGILWKLSFGYLLLYRAYRIIERFLILILLYKMLLKVTKPHYACFAAFSGIVLSTATVFDLCGDYNQTCDFIAVILCNILLIYCKHFVNNNSKKEWQTLFVLGIVLGFSFLLKQTIFVASVLLIFITLTILFVITKHKNYIKSIILTLAGFLIPVIICFAILTYHNALTPFFEQVFFSADSKGSLFSVLTSIIRITTTYKTLYLTIILLFCFYRIAKYNDLQNWFYLFIALSSYLIIFETDIKTILPFVNTHKGKLLVLVFCLLLVVSLLLDFFDINKKGLCYIPFLSCGLSLLLFDYYLTVKTHVSNRIYMESNLFSMVNTVSKLCCAISIILIIYQFHLYRASNDATCLKWIFLLMCGLICMYHLAMGASDDFNPRALIICIPVLTCYLLEKIPHHFFTKNLLVLSILVCLCVGIVSQKVTCTYSWWGSTSTTLDKDHTCTPTIKAMRGLRLSAYEANMYNELYRVLERNMTSDTSVYSFPQTQIFNVLLNNTNEAGFVPVPFYDTCADKYAIEDAKLLAKDPPDILIWCDIPGCMEAHENIYRNGEELGQRSIQRLFSVLVRRGDYSLIGQYNNIFIYKYNVKNSNSKTNYTYIEDASRVNSTLQ